MEHSALSFSFFWVALYILTLALVRSVQLFFLYLLLYYIILLLSPVANPQFDYTLKPYYFHKDLRVDVHSHHIVLSPSHFVLSALAIELESAYKAGCSLSWISRSLRILAHHSP